VKLSVVTPAHNEEAFLGGCLASIDAAANAVSFAVEKIVVLNRCSDGTERIALEHGARVVLEDARNLSRIRNAGVAAAAGEWIVTIDADSRMAPDLIAKVAAALEGPQFIGGGVNIVPERMSAGIRATQALIIAEDVDFAERLRRYGKNRGQRYLRLDSHIVTSCRKFDHFGDWHWFTKIMAHPVRMRRAVKGTDTGFTDEYFYDFNKRD
jgi:glycosyltransferase involved in cell wall biosynthesis